MGYSEKDHFGSALVLNPGIVSKLRRLAWFPFRQGYLIGVDTPAEVSRRPVNRKLASAPPQSFFTAHVGFATALLDAILAHNIAPIMVYRDPRAVLVSFVHYVAKRKEHVLHSEFKNLSMEERFQAVLEGRRFKKAYLEPLRTRCNALDGWLSSEQVLKIRFEDLVGVGGGGTEEAQRKTLLQLAEWLDIENPPIDKIREELFGPGRHTFRKGQIASWQDELPAPLHDRVDELLGDILDRWGYYAYYDALPQNV